MYIEIKSESSAPTTAQLETTAVPIHAPLESSGNSTSFQPKSAHVRQVLRQHPEVLDPTSEAYKEADALARWDADWLAFEQAGVEWEWQLYHQEAEMRTRVRTYAKRRAAAGHRTVLLAFEEYVKQCPNLPPHKRMCAFKGWASSSVKSSPI